MTKKPRRIRLPHIGPLAASLLLTTILIVPLSYYLVPYAIDWRYVSLVTSPDQEQRARGLAYIKRHAADKPHVARWAAAKLDECDQDQFLEIMQALYDVGRWRYETIGKGPWLRWLGMLAEEENPELRMAAIKHLLDLPELADEPAVSRMLESMIADKDDDVRYNALIAAAELLTRAAAPSTYGSIITTALDDTQRLIASQAWILTALLPRDALGDQDWHRILTQSREGEIQGIVAWARIMRDPSDVSLALQLAATKKNDYACNMAVYALSLTDDPKARDLLKQLVVDANKNGLADTNQLWRAVLALPKELVANDADVRDALTKLAAHDGRGVIRLAAIYRSGPQALPEELPSHDTLSHFAAYEGLAPASRDVTFDRAMSTALRLVTARAASNLSPDELYRVLVSVEPTMRDIACVLAARRFTPEQNARLVARLLDDFNDNGKRSGAILAGLTGVKPTVETSTGEVDLLTYKLRSEDVWLVQQIQMLGRWMRDGVLDTGLNPRSWTHDLLARDDVPNSTVLLAMLQREPRWALSYLFAPRVERPRMDLATLLEANRWWDVLKNYLPDDAPKIWYWADTGLLEFQIEVLRNWYLLNQHRFDTSPSSR